MFQFEQYSQFSQLANIGGGASSLHPLLAIVSGAGLPTPNVAIDFSEAASGSFTNHGLDGGTFDEVGTATYAQTFPITVGGTGVLYDNVATDGFEGSTSEVGNAAAGESFAFFHVFSCPANTANRNAMDKRNLAGSAEGVHYRIRSTGVPQLIFVDDSGTSKIRNLTTSVADGNDNYVAGSCDFNADNLYANSNLDTEVSTALAGGVDNLSSAAKLKLGLGHDLGAHGDGSGIDRYFLCWTGANAEGLRQAQWDALFVALGGTL